MSLSTATVCRAAMRPALVVLARVAPLTFVMASIATTGPFEDEPPIADPKPTEEGDAPEQATAEREQESQRPRLQEGR